jgi:hypothetical protein
MSFYAERITALAPDTDPAHVEAWMRLEYGTLDGLGPARFAAEVITALECIEHAGLDESDKLARSYGLQPQPRYALGDHVLVEREGGLEPALAVIDGENEHRPHLVKVKYLDSRTGAWIARKRITGRAEGRGG